MASELYELPGKIAKHLRRGTMLSVLGITIRHRVHKGYTKHRKKLKDLLYVSRPDVYYGETAAGYIRRRTGSKKWQTEQSIVRDLLRDVPDGSTVLDVPFGTGRFVDLYLQKGMKICGLDISEDMIAAAETELGDAFGHCDVYIGSANELPFHSGRFDLIVCCRFISMIPLELAREVLAEFHRVSNGKTILYMNIRREQVDWAVLLEKLLVWCGGSPTYVRRLGGNITASRFADLLLETGFDVADRRIIHDGETGVYYFYVLEKKTGSRIP